MEQCKILDINLTEGLLVGEKTNVVFGGFGRHEKIVLVRIPWKEGRDFILPEILKDFKVKHGWTDSISLEYWRPSGYKHIYQIAKEIKEKELHETELQRDPA